MSESERDARLEALFRRHFRLGWISILVYLLLGLVLEFLHAFKVGWYLDVANETRRHMWTLAHTHGTLFGLLNLAFAYSLPRLTLAAGQLSLAAWCFVIGLIGMPLGFFLGGIVVYGGDPGLPVLIAPASGAVLVIGVALVVWGARRGRAGD